MASQSIASLEPTMGTLMNQHGVWGIDYTITIIRNPQKSIGNWWLFSFLCSLKGWCRARKFNRGAVSLGFGVWGASPDPNSTWNPEAKALHPKPKKL